MPNEKAPAPRGVRTGDRSMDGLYPTEEIQTEQPAQDLGLVSDLTDIPEVARFADRIGARARSLRKLVVEEKAGRYRRDLAVITFDDQGKIDAPAEFAPKDAEREAILAAWKRYRWPEYRPILWMSQHAPSGDKVPWKAKEQDLAFCWDQMRELILCVEERRDREDGAKDVFIWTPWNDGRWRIAEPPGLLPLYGLETIQNAATIYIHEGPKAAKAVQRLVSGPGEYCELMNCGGWKDHPWGAELHGSVPGAVAHVGWLGGAHRALATDWSPLIRSGARIVIVCDNDRPGIDAAPVISRALGVKCDALVFNAEWPDRFDLADPFPPDRAEAGTRMVDLLRPATWATDQISARGSPIVPRAPFIAEWLYTVAPPLFFHERYRGRGFSADEVDALCRPFSGTDHTARLIRQRFSAQADGVAYRPGDKSLIDGDGRRLVNLWIPPAVQPKPGACVPLGRLLCHMFPVREDRRHAVRWGATLVACPKVRMEYAVVLQSKTQGLGKTTLADLLGRLVGAPNVSRPNETALTESQFNSHLAKKRLVICDELYSNRSSKTYDKLKSPITDKTVRVNEKHEKAYEIENYAHFVFTSNDLIPIFLDASDRRFFIPTLAERKLPREFWVRFHAWIEGGGLSFMAHCAAAWVAKHGAVQPGEPAPISTAKRALIDNSVSDEMRSVREAARDIFEKRQGESGRHVAVAIDDFQSWHLRTCAENGWRRLNGPRLKQALREAGLTLRLRAGDLDQRVLVNNRKVNIAANFDPDQEANPAEAVRDALATMETILSGRPM